MSREKPAPKLKLPDTARSEGVGKKMELPLSAETILTSANLAEKVAHGEKLSKEDIAELMKKSAGDLKKQGVTITDEDIQHASDAAYASLQAPNIDIDKELGLTEKELTPPNLSEYRKTLESVMKTYHLDKGKWNSIAALLGVNELAGAVVEGKRNYALTYGLANQVKILDEAATLAGMDTIKVQDWRQSIQKLKDEPGNTKKFLKLVGKGSWPIWSMGAQWLVQGGISQYANRLYMKERAKLEDMVNTRVAASLFMGDFSKYHDMPASTMMQVINRGKDATVELVATTHFDLVSAAAQTVGYPLGQLFAAEKPMNWIASGFALAKMGIAGPSAFARAREKHVTNARELKIWEDINQELMTTLTNIETVRTSGKAHEGAVMLKETLADKDYVGAGGLQQQMQRDRWMNLAFDVMDVSLPFATFGLDVRDGIRDEEHPLTLKGLFTHLWSLGGNIRYVKGEQMIARQAIQRLSQLYIDRITPYIEDVRRMEELLGPYDQLDMPGGEQEEKRVGVDALKTFDISVKDLSYKNILHHVNLEIPQGTFTAIKGPSGIGKTTLLRHLVGLYRPDKGSVAVGGVSTEGIKKYGDQALIHHIGYAGQSSEFLEGWTLRENLMLGAGEIPEQKVLSVMHDLGLDHLKDRLDSTVKHYSGGEKRRIGIARALLKDPKVLVLDEPTANLDAVSTQQVLDIIHKLRVKRPDMTVLAITHDPAFERIAEQVVDFAQVNKKPSIPVTLNDRQVLEAVAKAPTGKH